MENHKRTKKDAPVRKTKSLKEVYKTPKGSRKRSYGAKIREQSAKNLLIKVFEKMSEENFTLTDLANFLGITFQTVSRWYNGHRVPQGSKIVMLQSYLSQDLSNIDHVLDSNKKADNSNIAEVKVERSSLNGPSITGSHFEFDSDLMDRAPVTAKTTDKKKKISLVKRITHNRHHIPSTAKTEELKGYRP